MAEVCDVTNRPPEPDENLDDDAIKAVLQNSKTVAVVGLSNKPHRESYGVGKYLVANGYEIFPVHPNVTEWEGNAVYKSLADIPQKIDIIDLFRRSDAIDEMVEEIIAAKAESRMATVGDRKQPSGQKVSRRRNSGCAKQMHENRTFHISRR